MIKNIPRLEMVQSGDRVKVYLSLEVSEEPMQRTDFPSKRGNTYEIEMLRLYSKTGLPILVLVSQILTVLMPDC
jgi:hypothetical protein